MMRRHGFTLIELLVVMVIIGLLVGIILPVFQRIRESGRMSLAASQAALIENAIKAYFVEYGSWPTDAPGQWQDGHIHTYRNNKDVLDRLRVGGNPANPNNRLFIESGALRDDGTHYVDPWEQPFYIRIDRAYPGGSIANGVVVYYRVIAGTDGAGEPTQFWHTSRRGTAQVPTGMRPLPLAAL